MKLWASRENILPSLQAYLMVFHGLEYWEERRSVTAGRHLSITSSMLGIGISLRVRNQGKKGRRLAWISKELMDKLKGKKKVQKM